ncbi:MAG: hypothetical protein C4308_14170, partial [Chitinophagaceae bacterium]
SSSVETFPITLNNIPGSSSTNTVTIRPASDATGLSISGSNTTAIFDFNTASNYIIDGRAGGSGISQLTISNTSTTDGTAARFINDATSNVIRYTTLKSSFTSTTTGIISFSTSAYGVTGNSNNIIDNNTFDGGAAA